MHVECVRIPMPAVCGRLAAMISARGTHPHRAETRTCLPKTEQVAAGEERLPILSDEIIAHEFLEKTALVPTDAVCGNIVAATVAG